MKIITLHQPWASLVALKLKKYETRHWGLITEVQYSFMLPKKADLRAKQVYVKVAHHFGHELPRLYDMPFGKIVAIANLTKCLQMITIAGYETPDEIGVPSVSELEQWVGLWEPGRFALQLDNVRSLPNPIPFKSRQGKLLDAPADIIALVNEQLKEMA